MACGEYALDFKSYDEAQEFINQKGLLEAWGVVSIEFEESEEA